MGPCGVVSRGRTRFVSGFALPPAGAVTSAGLSPEDFAAAAAGACAAAPPAKRDAIASRLGTVRLGFTCVLLGPGIYCAGGGASLDEKAKTFFPSANVTVLALAICDPSLAWAPSTVT